MRIHLSLFYSISVYACVLLCPPAWIIQRKIWIFEKLYTSQCEVHTYSVQESEIALYIAWDIFSGSSFFNSGFKYMTASNFLFCYPSINLISADILVWYAIENINQSWAIALLLCLCKILACIVICWCNWLCGNEYSTINERN